MTNECTMTWWFGFGSHAVACENGALAEHQCSMINRSWLLDRQALLMQAAGDRIGPRQRKAPPGPRPPTPSSNRHHAVGQRVAGQLAVKKLLALGNPYTA